jgi:hypothetical protein
LRPAWFQSESLSRIKQKKRKEEEKEEGRWEGEKKLLRGTAHVVPATQEAEARGSLSPGIRG